MQQVNRQLGELLGLTPDKAQQQQWAQTLERLAQRLQPLVSTTLQPPAEFARMTALAKATERARQIVGSLASL